MTATTPPGYASTAGESSLGIAFPVAASVFAAASLLTAFHEVCVATPRAYAPLSAPSYPGVTALAAAGAAFALCFLRKARRTAATSLALCSLFSALSAHVFVFAFVHGAGLSALVWLVPLLGGVVFGRAAAALLSELGAGLAALEALPYLANPLRLALIGVSLIALLLSFPLLGILRRAALLAALLAGASVLVPWVRRLLGEPPEPSQRTRWLPLVAPFAALASLLASHVSMPLEQVRKHGGDVVAVLNGPRGEHVVSRLQGGMLLFSDDVLATTSTDAARFAEALVHPAFALAARRAQVLVLDDGAGSVEREALRVSDLEALWFVPHDPALANLARSNPWFRELGADAAGDRRVHRVDVEAARFVTQGTHSFDVILLNLGDPSSYRSGKYFSRFWFETLRKHLSPGGVIALQATSPLRTPGAHASILATLRSAGLFVAPYRAALPTLGEWGFALAFADERPLEARLATAKPIPQGTRYVTSTTLGSLLSTNPSVGSGAVNHLFDQPVVELYRREDQAFNE